MTEQAYVAKVRYLEPLCPPKANTRTLILMVWYLPYQSSFPTIAIGFFAIFTVMILAAIVDKICVVSVRLLRAIK